MEAFVVGAICFWISGFALGMVIGYSVGKKRPRTTETIRTLPRFFRQ